MSGLHRLADLLHTVGRALRRGRAQIAEDPRRRALRQRFLSSLAEGHARSSGAAEAGAPQCWFRVLSYEDFIEESTAA